jgi:thiol-disulfide isomerase/thioredoxin
VSAGRLGAVGLLALAVVAGCGGGRSARAPRGPAIYRADAEQVLQAVREPGARAVLVNVWATWCMPCREEFPDVMRLAREYRASGLRVVLVSADFDDALPQASAFLLEHGVDFPSYLKTGDDMKFINALEPSWSGAIPASILYDGAGRKVRFWAGRQTYDTLAIAVRRVLRSQAGHDSVEVKT